MPEFVHINDETTLNHFNKIKKNKPVFIKYYMNGCGHCDNLEPIWDLVEERIQKEHSNCNSLITQLNADYLENTDVPNVIGFPTISVIIGINKIDHEGERTEDAIMDFFKKNGLSSVQNGGRKKNKLFRKMKQNIITRRYKSRRYKSRSHIIKYGIKNSKVIKIYPHKKPNKYSKHKYIILWKTTKQNLPNKIFHGKLYKTHKTAKQKLYK